MMESFGGELFEMLELDGGTILGIGTVVYGAVAILRKKMPGDLMKGWVSNVVGAVIAGLLAWKAVPYDIATMLLTALFGWGTSMLGADWLKNTKLEIKRNGR